jgi:hypothetical protein
MLVLAPLILKSPTAKIAGEGCALCPFHSLSREKKKSCCKSFKHGKRCKKCPGKKK